MSVELLQRRIDELLAVMGIFGQEAVLQVSPEELFAFLLTGGTDAAGVKQLTSENITLSLAVPLPEHLVPPGLPEGEPLATLSATLPPQYPEQQPCSCSVWSTSPCMPRQWQTSSTAHLQAMADAAAQESRECLFDLLQTAQQLMEEAVTAHPGGITGGNFGSCDPQIGSQQAGSIAQQGGESSTAPEMCKGDDQQGPKVPTSPQQQQQLQQGGAVVAPLSDSNASNSAAAAVGGAEGPVKLSLLKIDHMHDRRGYCRTVRRWCGELALSGRLLFLGGLILAVLEGPPEDVKECLAYWRTRSVDVDSKGRPCKERMMDVVAEEHRPARCFASFGELDLSSVAELEAVLRQAGVAGWLPLALGFAPGSSSRLKR